MDRKTSAALAAAFAAGLTTAALMGAAGDEIAIPPDAGKAIEISRAAATAIAQCQIDEGAALPQSSAAAATSGRWSCSESRCWGWLMAPRSYSRGEMPPGARKVGTVR